MLKVILNSKEITLEKKKNIKEILEELNLIEECSVVLKNGKLIGFDEKIKEGDEIEIITIGWEKL